MIKPWEEQDTRTASFLEAVCPIYYQSPVLEIPGPPLLQLLLVARPCAVAGMFPGALLWWKMLPPMLPAAAEAQGQCYFPGTDVLDIE